MFIYVYVPACMNMCLHVCVHVHKHAGLCSSLLAPITKIPLVLISYLIQCSGACRNFMGEQFVRVTVDRGW